MYATQGVCIAYLMFNGVPVDYVVPQLNATPLLSSTLSFQMVSASGYALGEFMHTLAHPIKDTHSLSANTVIKPIIKKGIKTTKTRNQVSRTFIKW